MSRDDLFISIDEDKWSEEYFDVWPHQVFQTTISFIRQHELYGKVGSGKTVFVNLSLSNDEEVHHLNKQFRGIDKPTNVLSFANVDDVDFVNEIADCEQIELGDIVIALETLQREAEQKNILLRDHFAHLLIH
ncbi:MAG: rRNA maturation RNase YbeY, partial [Alphaproteobacteria bacterium]|nr:rRNA maturation RNase YbeY [Alphaproteobacteria bacterium]